MTDVATVTGVDSPLGTFLCPPGFAAPRGLGAIAREGSAVAEAARFLGRTVRDRLGCRQMPPHGDRQGGQDPVVLVPGFMAGDGSLGLMARHLRGLGHRTYRSTMHANVGCTREATEVLERRVEGVAAKRDRKVTIIGHSLGGLLARGLAARRPDLVDGIVVLGSPLLAPGAAHRLLLLDVALVVRLRQVGLGGMMGADCTSGECARSSWEAARAPLAREVAFTSVFSRRDGIIDWRGCLDPQAKTVEVRTSHLGMAFDPVVLDVVAATLAANRERRDRTISRQATLAEVPHASAG